MEKVRVHTGPFQWNYTLFQLVLPVLSHSTSVHMSDNCGLVKYAQVIWTGCPPINAAGTHRKASVCNSYFLQVFDPEFITTTVPHDSTWSHQDILDLLPERKDVQSHLSNSHWKPSERMEKRCSQEAFQSHIKAKELQQNYKNTQDNDWGFSIELSICAFYKELDRIFAWEATVEPWFINGPYLLTGSLTQTTLCSWHAMVALSVLV